MSLVFKKLYPNMITQYDEFLWVETDMSQPISRWNGYLYNIFVNLTLFSISLQLINFHSSTVMIDLTIAISYHLQRRWIIDYCLSPIYVFCLLDIFIYAIQYFYTFPYFSTFNLRSKQFCWFWARAKKKKRTSIESSMKNGI